jgi:hypothetical protein
VIIWQTNVTDKFGLINGGETALRENVPLVLSTLANFLLEIMSLF